MAKIDKNVRLDLNSFESSELERILEAVEDQEYYGAGLNMLSGGYAFVTAYELEVDDDADGKEIELVLIDLESGVQEDGHTSCSKSICKIPRHVLSAKMDLKTKLKAVVEY